MVGYKRRCHPSYEVGILREFAHGRRWPLGCGQFAPALGGAEDAQQPPRESLARTRVEQSQRLFLHVDQRQVWA